MHFVFMLHIYYRH